MASPVGLVLCGAGLWDNFGRKRKSIIQLFDYSIVSDFFVIFPNYLEENLGQSRAFHQTPILGLGRQVGRDQTPLVHSHLKRRKRQKKDKKGQLHSDDTEVAPYGSCHSHLLSCQSCPISLAQGTYSSYKPRGTSCSHGCVLDSPIYHQHSSNFLSHSRRILIVNTLSHVKHVTSLKGPSWLPRTGRLTVRGCR